MENDPEIDELFGWLEEDDAPVRLAKSLKPRPRAENIFTGNRVAEIGAVIEQSAKLNLPATRRPTLSEYDSRRPLKPVDRYHFGIYAGKYE
jgi:hypothetical protein